MFILYERIRKTYGLNSREFKTTQELFEVEGLGERYKEAHKYGMATYKRSYTSYQYETALLAWHAARVYREPIYTTNSNEEELTGIW